MMGAIIGGTSAAHFTGVLPSIHAKRVSIVEGIVGGVLLQVGGKVLLIYYSSTTTPLLLTTSPHWAVSEWVHIGSRTQVSTHSLTRSPTHSLTHSLPTKVAMVSSPSSPYSLLQQCSVEGYSSLSLSKTTSVFRINLFLSTLFLSTLFYLFNFLFCCQFE